MVFIRYNSIRVFFTLLLSIALSNKGFAHHPNEGNVALSTLLEEAKTTNFEIKEAEKEIESVKATRKQSLSAFLPQVSIDGGYQKSKFDEETSDGTSIYGNAQMNLYRGGKDSAARKVTEEEVNFQLSKFENVKAKIEREISRKYYELLYIQEGLDLKEQALTANKTQMGLAQKKKAAGFTSEADVLEFELREATLNSDVNFLKQEESIKERELQVLVGRDSEKSIHVSGHLERISFEKEFSNLLSQSLNRRLDLKEAQKNKNVSELNSRALLGDYLPRLDLETKYGRIANEERVFSDKNNYYVGLKFSIPLFSGLDTYNGRIAKAAEIARNEVVESRIKSEIPTQIKNALTKLHSINERLDLEQKNIDRAKKYYDLTVSEYKRGVKNSPDVAGAAERLFDAKLRNLEYRRDYYIARLEVAEAVGVSTAELEILH